MTDQSDQIEYYTAGAAQIVLKIDYNELRGFVANGSIRREKLAGRKHYVYRKDDVDKLAEQRRKDGKKFRVIDKGDIANYDNNLGNITDGQRGSALFTRG